MPTRGSYRYQKQWLYDPDYGQVDGASLWQRMGLLVTGNDPQPLIYSEFDWDMEAIASNTTRGWVFNNVTSGTVTKSNSLPSGVLVFNAGAATANQGVQLQLDNPALRVAANKPVAFESYLQFTGLNNLRIQFFVGLAAINSAVIASGAMAAIDRIGFQGITTTGVLNAVTRGGGTAQTATGLTIVNNTFYRLGFFATSSQIDFYVNGLIVSSLTTQIPTSNLAPVIVVQANGTDTPVVNLDQIAWAGVR